LDSTLTQEQQPMAKNIIEDATGQVPFTCEHRHWQTDMHRGISVPPRTAAGSVLSMPLLAVDGQTLWLEHVYDISATKPGGYWLVWYNEVGWPLHGPPVFHQQGIADIGSKLTLSLVDMQQLKRTLSLVAP
jgi:hypothetical protein